MLRILFLICLAGLLATARAADEKLNYVVMLIDDLGASDLGCYGSPFYETPNIDRLAKDGVKFTAAYSACTVCSPTRAALMTGMYPARLHLTDWIPGHTNPLAKLSIPDWTKELKPETTTIAELLRERGYVTAHFGKWHLRSTPQKHGFDVSVADNGLGQPVSYLSPYKNPHLSDGPPGEELTGRLTAEVEHFIDENRAKPFFIYLAHFAVHTPLGGKPESIEKYKAKAAKDGPHRNPAYAAMIEAVDDSVGRLRAKLEAAGLWDKTVFVFTSDNGGLTLGKPPVTENIGLRAGKGSAYEGGTRVAAICRWPGLAQPGKECPTPIITMDWFASLAASSGDKAQCDGVDIRPLLEGKTIAERSLYWHYPHYHPGGATPYSSVRSGNLSLIEFFEDSRTELYDLASDPLEKHDLAKEKPEIAQRLQQQLKTWRQDVGAQLPTPNPKYVPKERRPRDTEGE